MRKAVKLFWRIFIGGFLGFILLMLLANWGVFGKMPSIEELQNPSATLASQIYGDDGTLLGKYYANQDRVNVEFKDINKHIIDALVATEDERFYDHSGIDGKALARAFVFLGSEGGASTITMQTAKNLFTENWSTKNILLRSLQKLKESIIAVKLEKNFTKDEILALYLNTVPFGDNVYGIRNASKTFFQKEPDRVTVDEAAVLIGMLKASTAYNPRIYPKRSQERRNIVMFQMVKNGKMTKPTYDELKVKPIPLNYKKLDETTGLAPYFRMVLGEELKKWCAEHKKSNGDAYNIYKDGLKIYTTINPRMQMYAEEAVAKHLPYMQKFLNSQQNLKTGAVWKGFENVLEAAVKNSDRWKNGEKNKIKPADLRASFNIKVPMKVFSWNSNFEVDTIMTPMDSIKYHRQILQAGFMAMDPISGEVKAWVGGANFKYFKYDHVNINTKRQVGSTMKPLLYSLAIEEGGMTPQSMVQDVQQNFGAAGMVPNTPKSCTGGTMPMVLALAMSRNCASGYLMKQLGGGSNDGPKRFTEFLKNCNLQTNIPAVPSIALGSCEISLYEMMQAYSMFPGRGFNVKPMFVARIEDRNGNVLENFSPLRKEVISEVTAYSIIKMMQEVMKIGTGRRIWSYGVDGEIAGKTGTTNDNSDGWFMGYTPQLLCGAWVGCDDRFIRFNSTDLGQGSSVALPIWAYFYEKAANDRNIGLDNKATFVKPEVMTNDLNFDYLNNVNTVSPGEGEDTGSGTETDYGGEDEQQNGGGGTIPQTPPAQQPKAILPKKPYQK
jgi:penicillin-binding protein 1A